MTNIPKAAGKDAPGEPAAPTNPEGQPQHPAEASDTAQPANKGVAAGYGSSDESTGFSTGADPSADDCNNEGGNGCREDASRMVPGKRSGKSDPADAGLTEQTGKPEWIETDVKKVMRIHPEQPRVVRLSRKALIGLGSVASLVLSGVLFWAFAHPEHVGPPPELINTDERQASEALNTLPKDYTDIPRLGPPLPGDLGRPMVAAGVAANPSAAAPSAPTSTPHPDPRVQAREQARLRLAQEREAARSAQLFATETQSPAAAAPALILPAAVPETTAPTGSEVFPAGRGDGQTVASARLTAAAGPAVLQAGSIIPAAMITGLRSDLPGQITAQVTENVYDSVTGHVLLIPQGARLIGKYDAQTRFGQKRALLVWTRLILPDGRSMLLDRQPGADAEGAAGLADRVNNHWSQIFKAALITTVLGLGSELGAGTEESVLLQALRRGGADATAQIGRQLVERSLDIQPTISIRPGYPVRVIVTRDLVLEPWKG